VNKTYHFLTGLPRSGSTVLSALINQHPEIYASPQTELLEMIFQIQNVMHFSESYNAEIRKPGYQNVIKKITDNFYSDVNKPIILDKNRGWGTPYNMENVMPIVNQNPKIVVTLRPIVEILASFTALCNKNPNNTIDKGLSESDFWPIYYRNYEDARCEYMMRPNGEIDQAILSISNLQQNHKDSSFFLWYEDLVFSPEIKLQELYNFLGTKPFKNNFNNIEETDKHNDMAGYGIKNLHAIKNKISKSKTDYKTILSNSIIKKYENALDFLF